MKKFLLLAAVLGMAATASADGKPVESEVIPIGDEVLESNPGIDHPLWPCYCRNLICTRSPAPDEIQCICEQYVRQFDPLRPIRPNPN